MENKNLSALVVSDAEELLLMVDEELNEQKYRVVLARKSDEARLKYSNEKFDLVIVDIDMKSFKSLEFVQNIRRKEECKNIKEIIPILILGSEPERFTPHFSTIDHTRFLEKPFDKAAFKKKALEFSGNNSSEVINSNSRKIKKDEYLITEGGKSHEMYWILSGSFVVTKINTADQNVIIGKVYSGELVGEMSFLDNLPRSASVRALEESEVLVIPHKKFINVVEGQPRWFRSLMQTLSHRLRNTNKMIARKYAEIDKVEESEVDDKKAMKQIDI